MQEQRCRAGQAVVEQHRYERVHSGHGSHEAQRYGVLRTQGQRAQSLRRKMLSIRSTRLDASSKAAVIISICVVRATVSRFTTSLWIAFRERSL
jgi:hypothetical protein